MSEPNDIPEPDQPSSESEPTEVPEADQPPTGSEPTPTPEADQASSAPEPVVRSPVPSPDQPQRRTASYPPRPPKDKGVALILEILPGLFGILGLGWIYSGNTTVGVAWLAGVLFWDFIAVIVLVLTGGLGCLCTIPVNLVLIAISALFLNTYISQHDELFTVQ